MSINTFNLVKEYAEILENLKVLGCLKANKYFKYMAFVELFIKDNWKKKPDANLHVVRRIHETSFEALCQIIDKKLIDQEKLCFLTDLRR